MTEKKPERIVTASGKRKMAVARATVRKGIGRVRINSVPIELFQPEIARMKMLEPLMLAVEKRNIVDINVEVHGGGIMGQATAARTAIANGIVDFLGDDALAGLFKQYDRSLLVSDPRRKLPKKPCGRGARKRRQKSYR
jgi:small subunit ribosomal protein S9